MTQTIRPKPGPLTSPPQDFESEPREQNARCSTVAGEPLCLQPLNRLAEHTHLVVMLCRIRDPGHELVGWRLHAGKARPISSQIVRLPLGARGVSGETSATRSPTTHATW
jgi:hypothetical protein